MGRAKRRRFNLVLTSSLLFYAWCGQWVYPRPATAQALTLPTGSNAQCRAIVRDRLQELYRRLEMRLAMQLYQEQYAAAATAYRQLLEFIAQVPARETRVDLFQRLSWPSFARGGQFGELNVVTTMAERGDRPEVIAALDEAVQIAQSFDSDAALFKTHSLISIAHLYSALDASESAKRTLALARAAYDTDQGYEPLLAIARIYQSLGDHASFQTLTQQALSTMGGSSEPRPFEQQQSLAILGAAYAAAGDIASAQQLARQITIVSPNTSLIEPAIVQWYLQAGQPQEALAIATQISDNSLQAQALGDIARYYAVGQGEDARALQILETALAAAQASEEPDIAGFILADMLDWYPEQATPWILQMENTYQQVPLLGALAAHYRYLGQQGQADALIAQFNRRLASLDPSWHSTLLSNTIAHTLASGLNAESLWLIETLTPEHPDWRKDLLLDRLIPALVGQGEISLLEQAVAALPDGDPVATTDALITLAAAYVSSGNVDRALAFFARPASDRQEDFLRWSQIRARVAQQLIVSGQNEFGLEVLEQSQRQIMAHGDPMVRSEALGHFVLALGQTPQPLPESLLHAWQTSIQATDRLDQETLLQPVMEGLMQTMDLPAAFRAIAPFDAAHLSEFRDRTLADIMTTAITLRHYDLAQQTIDQLTDPSKKILGLVILADHFMLEQPSAEARPLLDQAVAIALTLPGTDSRQRLDREMGREMNREMDREMLSTGDDPYDRTSLLETIAVRYMQLDAPQAARETLELLPAPALRQQAIERVECFSPNAH